MISPLLAHTKQPSSSSFPHISHLSLFLPLASSLSPIHRALIAIISENLSILRRAFRFLHS